MYIALIWRKMEGGGGSWRQMCNYLYFIFYQERQMECDFDIVVNILLQFKLLLQLQCARTTHHAVWMTLPKHFASISTESNICLAHLQRMLWLVRHIVHWCVSPTIRTIRAKCLLLSLPRSLSAQYMIRSLHIPKDESIHSNVLWMQMLTLVSQCIVGSGIFWSLHSFAIFVCFW